MRAADATRAATGELGTTDHARSGVAGPGVGDYEGAMVINATCERIGELTVAGDDTGRSRFVLGCP